MLWLAWDRVVHSRSHKWAYIIVAGDRDDDGKSDEYKKSAIAFIQKLYPHLLVKPEEGKQNGG